jgi:hypothetical protein
MRYQSRCLVRIAICATLVVVQRCSVAQSTGAVGEENREASGGATTKPPAATQGFAVYTPMSQSERFHYYAKHIFSGEAVLRSAAGAGILQAINSPHEWGQGAEGYGRRFGNSYGQYIIRSTLMYGSSSAFHEDNRYFLSGESGFWPRLKYAVASTFLARREDGSRRVSYSRIGSVAATAFISREWQPPSANGPENAVSAMGTALGVEVGFNVAREFFPKVFHTAGPVRR